MTHTQTSCWYQKLVNVSQDNRFVWNYNSKNDILRLDYSPVTLFELLMSDDVVQSIAVSSVQYATEKGNHIFHLTYNDVRLFIAILSTSGYAVLPHRHMY